MTAHCTRAARGLLAVVLLLATAGLVLGRGPAARATSCGTTREPVAVGADADAASLDLASPSLTTVAGLGSLAAPHDLPQDARIGPVEDTVFTARATMTSYQLTDDGDDRLVLTDPSGATMTADIPDPACVPSSSPLHAGVVAARQAFDAQFSATSSAQQTSTPVQVSGAGFFGSQQGTAGGAPNGVTLDPVLAFATGSAPTAVGRVSGADRYSTAAALSSRSFPSGAPVAYVATGQAFPDALAAAAAAAPAHGPVLLVASTAIPAATRQELARLSPGRIVVVGGTAAVSASVQEQLASFTRGTVTRLSGADRYATAAAISAASFPAADTVYVATGRAFPDALSGAAAAGAGHDPVLLVADTVAQPTAAELTRLHPSRVVVLGGTASVSTTVQDDLGRYATSVTRLAGTDRYATSAAVAGASFPTATRAFLAAGTGFADALAGGAIAGQAPGPLLLTPTSCLATPVAEQLARLGAPQVTVVGGTGAVADSAANLAPCAPTDYPTSAPVPVTSPAPSARPTKVLTIVEENHTATSARSGMPYLAQLGNTYGYTTAYHAVGHPSLPNYLALAGGSTFGVHDDASPASHPIPGRSVFDQAIAAGTTAKTYAESMPTPCATSPSGSYAVKHNPWAYFTDPTSRANCRSNDVPAGTTSSGPLHDDVVHGTLPTVNMLIPNLCNDAHDCSLSTADSWLRGWLSTIEQGPDWRAGRLAVIITFDEDDNSGPNTVLTTVVSPQTRHVVSPAGYTHYSWTRYVDELIGAPPLGNATQAPSLRPAFGI